MIERYGANEPEHDTGRDYHFIVLQLLDVIRSAKTFHEACVAADALFHVRLMYKSLECEKQMHTGQPETQEASRD